jgi:hypothetical protein
MEIVTLTPDLEPDWLALSLADERQLIYASLEYRDFLVGAVPGEPIYLIARHAGETVGGLPCFRARAGGLGSVINSLPWYGSHGGCILAPDAPYGTREALLSAYAGIATAPEVLSATLILSPFEEQRVDCYRAALRPRVEDSRIGQITELAEGGDGVEERLMATISQKTRNLVRKSLRQGFERGLEDSDAAWDFLYRTHVQNLQAIGGKAKPRSHFEALRQCLPADWREVSVATLDGEPVAALLTLYFNRTVEYFTPVIRHDYRSSQPLSFLIWHGMLDAIDRGMRWWNWGGTWIGQKSLHHFKAGWGALDHPYSYMMVASPDAVETMRRHRANLGSAFPFYYTYPYALLD